ncbi:uncharacterized protein [Palaemon carinicauda]|uniref:uncharacterized protein n=1 Tax=Palaemon carinicauda TaxID=392227 RepID=UPI0035B63376
MEEQLIEYVRGYDLLFNPRNKDYRDQNARREAWEEISRKIGISADVCKDTWTKLRNAYTNARKRRNTKSGQAAKNIPKWKYEDKMSFLIPTLEPRSTHGNVEPLSQSDGDVARAVINENTEEDLNISQIDKIAASEKCAHDNGNQETTIADQSNGDQQVAGSTSTSKPKYRKRQILDSSISEIVNLMKDNSRMRTQSIQLSEGYKTHRDETEMFFLSIASSVKKLSAIEQARVKMEISNMVFKAQIRELEQQNLYQNTETHVECKPFKIKQVCVRDLLDDSDEDLEKDNLCNKLNGKNDTASEIWKADAVERETEPEFTERNNEFENELIEMDQTEFEEKLRETQESKAENAVLQPTAKRDKIIEDLLRINSHGATSPFDYNLQKRYEILHVGNVDRLIRKRKDPANDVFKFVASLEEVFDIVKAAHEGIGHGGGKKTIAEVKKKWSNITQEVCYLYISFCEHCHQKKAR